MSLVPFDPKFRRTWMLPRNIRYIVPWKISQILTIFMELSCNSKWSGNQQLQNEMAKLLEDNGLKRKGFQYDLHSGGPRTYRSQLKCLGLIFERGKDEIWSTMAGDALMEQSGSMIEILRKQIVEFQYPSAYSNEQNVWVDPRVKVKPFLFLLQLLLDNEICYLQDSEIIIPIIYGHNWNSYEYCKQKILKYRQGEDLEELIDDPDHDLYTRRSKCRNIGDALKDARDIANTFKNYLAAVGLVLSDFVPGDIRHRAIILNPSFIKYINEALLNKNTFIEFTTPEQYQRRYGLWGSTKDTRVLTKESHRVDSRKRTILSRFAEYAGMNIVTSVPEDFISYMAGQGIERSIVLKVIEPHLKYSLSYFEQRFLEIASGGTKTAHEFEIAVAKLFQEKLHYHVLHTGKKKRVIKSGGYSDIFLESSNKSYCAIVDAKAYRNYDLPNQDYLKMRESYVKSVGDFGRYTESSVRFCAYVAGNFSNSIDNRLKALSTESGINLSAIRAFEFLKLCQEDFTLADVDRLTEIFSKPGLHSKDDFSVIYQR